jgi:hypothetical protein
MWAAIRGHAICARLLVEAGADKEVKDKVCVSPCVCAVCVCMWDLGGGFEFAIAFLREARLHRHLIVFPFFRSDRYVHAFQKGITALDHAKEYNHAEIVQLLEVRLKKFAHARSSPTHALLIHSRCCAIPKCRFASVCNCAIALFFDRVDPNLLINPHFSSGV